MALWNMKLFVFNIFKSNTRVLVLLFFAYALIRCGIFYSLPWDSLKLTYDGREYLQYSHYALFSQSLFLVRPFLYPLVLKICHQNIYIIQNIQLFISILAWFYCACSLTLLTSTRKYKPLILISVLVYSLSFYIILWDLRILTESLSISALIGYFSIILRVLLNGLTLKKLSLLLIFSAALVFLKDSAAYLVAVISMPLILYLIMHLRHRSKYFLVMTSVLFIFTSALLWESNATANQGKRWLIPLEHVFVNRMPHVAEMPNYFNVQQLQDKNKIYKTFLITHPAYIVSPMNTADYWSSWWLVPSWLDGYLKHDNISISKPLAYISLMISCFANYASIGLGAFFLFILIRKRKLVSKDSVVLAVLYGFFAMGFLSLLIWHGDTLEIPRHQLETYLFMVLCLFSGCVRLLAKKQ